MSRNHNSLSEIKYDITGRIDLASVKVESLNLSVIACITNFHHLLVDGIERGSSSIVSSIATRTSFSDGKNNNENPKSLGKTLTSVVECDGVACEEIITVKGTKVSACETQKPTEYDGDVCEMIKSGTPKLTVPAVEYDAGVCEEIKSDQGTRSQTKEKHTSLTTTPTVAENKVFKKCKSEIIRTDKRVKTRSPSSSSSSSSSGKRMCQTDIRSLYAKVQEKKRKQTSSDCGITYDGERERKKKRQGDNGDGSLPNATMVTTASDQTRPDELYESKEDTASSFICTGLDPPSGSYLLNKYMSTEDEWSISGSSDTTKSDSSKTLNVICENNEITQITGPVETKEINHSERLLSADGMYFTRLIFNRSQYKKPVNNVEGKKLQFENSVKLNQLDKAQSKVHETDIQLLVSAHNKELDFYRNMIADATEMSSGLWVKAGSSLNANRDDCPTVMFAENVPRVLFSGDFVSETDWIVVLERYFDDYLNNLPFLYVMEQVLNNDAHVKARLSDISIKQVCKVLKDCQKRFMYDTKQKNLKKPAAPKHPSTEKYTVVVGLIAVCSLAFKMVTPIFTDLTKVCRVMIGSGKQLLLTLNASTMCTATHDLQKPILEEDELLDDSVSTRDPGNITFGADSCVGDFCNQSTSLVEEDSIVAASISNVHSVLASILRWNYYALGEDTSWGLFFYYYHVHRDILGRILDEVLHGGLMVTAVLQSYFELYSQNKSIDFQFLSERIYELDSVLSGTQEEKQEYRDEDRMPPPKSRGSIQSKKKVNRKNSKVIVRTDRQEKLNEFENRHEDAKRCQREFQMSKDFNTVGGNKSNDTGGDGDKAYKTSFIEIVSFVIDRYLRPVKHDDTTLVYSDRGYEPNQNETLANCPKEMLNKATVKYQMTHGDILIYNTDVKDTIHKGCFVSTNLVLNVFENLHGGSMTYLTRRFKNNLEIIQRFNADVYLLVVECRHAMSDFVRSVELSYMNLILRQPIVPPVLETDITIRDMFMSVEEIQKGSFVCLNAMDYVRFTNMFTRHSKFSQENCKVVESFLDKLITNKNLLYDSDEESNCCFRTVYLFYLLFIFEVLYKIRYTYNRDNTYYVSIDQLSRSLGVRSLLKLFFGEREFKIPRGLSQSVTEQLDLSEEYFDQNATNCEESFGSGTGNKVSSTRFINTRPIVSAPLPDKIARMMELFGKKGIIVMKSNTPLNADTTTRESTGNQSEAIVGNNVTLSFEEYSMDTDSRCSTKEDDPCSNERDREFLNMAPTDLEAQLYSSKSWYENCLIRLEAVRDEQKNKTDAEKRGLDVCVDQNALETILRTQLRVNIDNNRLNKIETAVQEKKDFIFCTHMPLRAKVMALVLATHSAKRMDSTVASDFIRKEYLLERMGAMRYTTDTKADLQDPSEETSSDSTDKSSEVEWDNAWNRLLMRRKRLLCYCRSLVDAYFPESYFFGLRPDDTYDALYNYMTGQEKYQLLHSLNKNAEPWVKNVCTALNYLLVMNAYDPELVELCLRLFLGFEWPGQWAKRIFVWKSNSNAGKSYFFENIIGSAFDQSTTINDPRGGKENAPEKAEYYKNFVLMINEFSVASAAELKKLCSTSSYKFRLNFSNKMINAFMSGKMVFNCNTLPLTTDHATIQRVALIPLPFWFEKKQTIVDAMLNWTRGQVQSNEFEKNFRRYISKILNSSERRFFVEHAKNESDLFNVPDDISIQAMSEINEKNIRSSMFLVQNKTSQVYMSCCPPINSIVRGILLITRYFCRYRFFNSLKEPVDYSVLPTACTMANQEWQRISQPYFDWKERYNVKIDYSTTTKVSFIHASLQHFAKNYGKNLSFFDLKQFFEWEFSECKIPNYRLKEDEFNVRLDPLDE